MKAIFAIVLSSCFLSYIHASAVVFNVTKCFEQAQCTEPGTCCTGVPPYGGYCMALTPEGAKCRVVPKTVPMFGDFFIGGCPCEEGLVCVQQGEKKNSGICQVPPTTAAPTEAVVDEASDSGSNDAAPAEAAAPEAAPAEE